jgi:hypothetical protein
MVPQMKPEAAFEFMRSWIAQVKLLHEMRRIEADPFQLPRPLHLPACVFATDEIGSSVRVYGLLDRAGVSFR